MKFASDDCVIIKKSGYKGKIDRTKEIIIYTNGTSVSSYEYYIEIPTGLSRWYSEEELKLYDEKFSKEFEIGFIDLLTNINLLHTKDFEVIRELQNKKYKLI
ncbi:hypothetical protein [Niallia taxi]|uniref:hypothetical protein n=1 Tax=Niallia taxi TaxID=2499688 RepID=UPI003008A67A